MPIRDSLVGNGPLRKSVPVNKTYLPTHNPQNAYIQIYLYIETKKQTNKPSTTWPESTRKRQKQRGHPEPKRRFGVGHLRVSSQATQARRKGNGRADAQGGFASQSSRTRIAQHGPRWTGPTVLSLRLQLQALATLAPTRRLPQPPRDDGHHPHETKL
ncbi:hypothetical protein BC567DRAFT_81673 [Phyllosticta citribraziliensis]